MIRILIPLVLLVIVIVLARRHLDNAPPGLKKTRQVNIAIGALAIILIILTLLQRMHWVAPLLFCLALAGRLIMQTIFKQVTPEAEPASTAMDLPPVTEEAALNILGLKKPYSEQDVIEAHRRLIQKVHPDRGGNDYLASQINHAKDKLLDILGRGI